MKKIAVGITVTPHNKSLIELCITDGQMRLVFKRRALNKPVVRQYLQRVFDSSLVVTHDLGLLCTSLREFGYRFPNIKDTMYMAKKVFPDTSTDLEDLAGEWLGCRVPVKRHKNPMIIADVTYRLFHRINPLYVEKGY